MNTHTTIRVESAERAALADIHRAAPSDLRDHLGLELSEVGDVLVSIARCKPTILINRMVGLGLAHPADRETVETLVERFGFRPTHARANWVPLLSK